MESNGYEGRDEHYLVIRKCIIHKELVLFDERLLQECPFESSSAAQHDPMICSSYCSHALLLCVIEHPEGFNCESRLVDREIAHALIVQTVTHFDLHRLKLRCSLNSTRYDRK